MGGESGKHFGIHEGMENIYIYTYMYLKSIPFHLAFFLGGEEGEGVGRR